MDKHQIREQLRSSLEFRNLWQQFLITFVLLGIFLLFAWARTPSDGGAIALSVGGLIIAPYLLFCVIRTVKIFRRLEDYFICRSVLRQPHGGMLRDTMYFTTQVEDPADGKKYFVDTHAIFYARGILQPLMEDYVNSTVTIACNRETGMVVVIG